MDDKLNGFPKKEGFEFRVLRLKVYV